MLPRETVLRCIIDQWATATFTTADLATAMDTRERQVRGAITWLTAGRLLECVGTEQRLDRKDRPYRAKVYRWTGRNDIKRVPHDLADRRRTLEITDASRFLSMRW